MTTNDAQYRKHNDHSQNSSTYHKKDSSQASLRGILKAEAAVEIKESLEERGRNLAAEKCGNVTFRIVVTTQVYENYGAHNWDGEGECPSYWKAKGGSEYHRNIGTASDVIALGSKGVQKVADEISAKISRDDAYFHETAINWNVIPSNEETYDEQMYREMLAEGYWPAATQDAVYADRMARLLV